MSSAPTTRLAEQLAGPSPWHTIEHLEEVESTNDLASRRVGQGARPGLVVVADRQTAGRGRAGRRWHSPADRPEASLLVSFLSGVPPEGLSLVPLAAGLAVADALRRQDLAPQLKWPNDVLLEVGDPPGDRKCAGILVDFHGEQEEVPAHLVVGVGVNVDWRGVDAGGDADAWTSVAEAGGSNPDRWEILAELMRSLAAWMRDVPQNPERLLGSYASRCSTLGRRVEVATPRGEATGVADRLSREGALIVTTDDGPRAVRVGDVTHLRPL